MHRLAFACFLSLASAAAMAQDNNLNSANATLPGCRAAAQPTVPNSIAVAAGWCLGAVAALTSSSPDICAPRSATQGQGVRVVLAYIDQRPARTHESFLQLASEALRSAWPCR
jgi:hypothetical protein